MIKKAQYTKQYYKELMNYICLCKQQGIPYQIKEIKVDNFAGGGGASTGIEIATGLSVDIAINHDPEAIRMHKVNHPSTKHYCENVWAVNPLEACEGRPVGLAWFSPDCKHFSKAKGGKPKDKNIRGLAWVALRWAALVRPRVIMLENVEEFKTWGPLNRSHRPIKEKQGVTFRKFVNQLEELGYTVEYRELIAADYGAPTMRKRFFLIARCDGEPIVWPEPTHGPADSEAVKVGLLKPYVGAYTQLDFSLPCPSIFDTSEEIKEKYGIKAVRPLAPKTMDRIARGLKKFVIDNAEPFIVQVNHSGSKSDYCNSMNEPLRVITAKHGFGIVEPKIAPIIDKAYGGNYQGSGSRVDEPIDTITTVDHNRLVEATLAPYMGTNTTNHPGGSCKDSIHTITTGNQQCLIEPKLAPYIEVNRSDRPGNSIEEPISTVTGVNQHCLISPTLIQYHGEISDDEVREQDIEKTLMTEDESNRYGLVTSFLSQYYDQKTYTGPRLHLQPSDAEEAERQLTSSCLIQMNNNCDGKDITKPIPTITAGDGHFGEVRAFLIKYYGQGTGKDIKEPLDTVTARDRFGLVTVNGVDYQIVDIGLRMLEPRELYGCQGVPDDYIIDHDCEGNVIPRSGQVRKCGNMVPPAFSAALVRANLPELCVGKRMPNMRIEAEKTGQLRFA